MEKIKRFFNSFKCNLTALASFIKNDKAIKELRELEAFIDEASIITKADKYGKITYVNKKFEKVSGWTLAEVIGKDHNIVNSGIHPKEMWVEMYRTVAKDKKIWNGIVINKTKKGELYYVDTYIKANFDEYGKLKGYVSIRQDVTEIMSAKDEIEKKNTYLEHAAKIIRHDMHSGINTYIPRGLTSLERKLSDEDVEKLKLKPSLKMIKEGLAHTQKVYKSVYEFTNLVKQNVVLDKKIIDLKEVIKNNLDNTSYSNQVKVDDLVSIEANETLIWNALDNLIKNGIKYNNSENKLVHIYMEGEKLVLEDNGFAMNCEKLNTGTKITITLNKTT